MRDVNAIPHYRISVKLTFFALYYSVNSLCGVFQLSNTFP